MTPMVRRETFVANVVGETASDACGRHNSNRMRFLTPWAIIYIFVACCDALGLRELSLLWCVTVYACVCLCGFVGMMSVLVAGCGRGWM